MDELKLIVASNLINLRTSSGMTQAELGGKLSYSDKSVSKWERAESMPDVAVLKQISDIFGVTVDFLISSHDDWENTHEEKDKKTLCDIITMVTLAGIFTVAFLVFTIFWILGSYPWIIFVFTLTVALIAWLVLNSIWNKGKNNWILVFTLVLSIIADVYVPLAVYTSKNPWQLFIVAIPAELVVLLSFLVAKVRKK